MGNAEAAVWWILTTDMNRDGQLTLTDVWAWLVQCFFMPGNLVLWCLLTYVPALGRLLDLGVGDYYGFFTGIVAAIAWFVAFVVAGTAYNFLRRVDRAVTGTIVKLYGECRRRIRVARIWAWCRLRAIKLRLLARGTNTEPVINLDEFQLGDVELEALRSHAFLAPGYVLSANDIAASLEIRTGEARQVVERLAKLGLLETSLGTSDGESGSRISRTGQFVLMARSRIAET